MLGIINKIKNNSYNKKIKKRGNNIIINGIISVDNISNLYLGNYVFLNNGMKINAMSEVRIGNNVIFGPEVMIWSADHNYENADTIPYDSKVKDLGVIIEDNVWIGGRVTILPGVRISEGAIIGMGSVVTRDVPYCAIVGGNPARILKYRDKEHYEEKKYLKHFYLNKKYN
ncbi:acyltransferase [Clostridium mediterraneense]|uniref:acyltransferase n=1 Tax=Clostridium mediterraneense TaxID=1805472 RepID=UPI00082CD025|nr:acyltransferase [Clostridium mediterraneense]